MIEQFGIAGDAGFGERQPRRINTDALPRLHLPLIALFGDLLVEAHRPHRMYDVGREGLVVIGRRVTAFEGKPCRFEPLAEASEKADAGDPHLAPVGHLTNSGTARLRRLPHSKKDWRNCGLGKGRMRNVNSASHTLLPSRRPLHSATV